MSNYKLSLEMNMGASLKDTLVIFISTETSFKEKGYLVAGVSKLGPNGEALVLIINAEIK
jgi:hypothetical protein